MQKEVKISDSELEVIKILWDSDEPLNIQEVCDKLKNKKWVYKTVGTLLIRMEEKGAVISEKRGRVNYYKPVIARQDYTKEKTKNLISKLYNGSVKELAVALFKSDDMKKEDIEEIRRMFDL